MTGTPAETPLAPLARPPYRIEAKAAPYSFKPYDRKRVRRDLHDARTASVKLSASLVAQSSEGRLTAA